MSKSLIQEIKDIETKLITMRRELHKIPETGESLPKTRQYVCKALDEIGIPYKPNKTDDGIVAEIKGAKNGKTIAFRADMDALNGNEDTGLPYASQTEGKFHGCGHDAHTAILLAAAEIINSHKAELSGTVRLIFQTGEETGSGAKIMLSEGALDGVDAICAIHVGNLAGDDVPTGSLVVLPGPVSAHKDKYTITVHGKGTHSAFPEKGIDPILVAARIVNATEEILAREVATGNPAVLSFGSFQAGLDHNTIPDKAVIKGSTRVHDARLRDFLCERIKCVAENLAKAFRAEAEVSHTRGSSAVENDEELASFVSDVLIKALGGDKVVTKLSSALMGADDFTHYAQRVPAVYFFLCTNNKDKNIDKANHNPSFDVDEDVLWEGALSYASIALEYLKNDK